MSSIPEYLKTANPRGGELVEKRDLPTTVEDYQTALRNLPASGGNGCHVALLSVANVGRAAGVSREQVEQDLKVRVVNHGTRKVTDREVEAAVNTAFSRISKPKRRERFEIDGEKFLKAILARGAEWTKADLWEASPVKVDWRAERDGVEALRRLYTAEEHLFLGERHEAGAGNVATVLEWIRRFEHGVVPPHIIPNPLTGREAMTKDGKLSYRADACVKRFAFAVIEFDKLSIEEQVAFWAGAKLPVVALIDSGGKSIHGWVRIDAADADEWEERVEGRLFDLLNPLGVDGSCKNEARLSRTPGHKRKETGNWQRLLYLAPEGRAVQP